MKKRIIDILLLVLSLVLAAGVKLVFHACAPMEDGMYMNCHNAENYVFICAIVLALLSCIRLFAGNKRPLIIGLDTVILLLSIVTALIPNVFVHLCMMHDMRCHSVMRPSVIMLCALTALVAVFDMILALRKNEHS